MEKGQSTQLDTAEQEAVRELADEIRRIIRLETNPLEHEQWHGGPYTPVSDFIDGDSPFREDWSGILNDEKRLKLMPAAIKRVLFDENGNVGSLFPEEAEALRDIFIYLRESIDGEKAFGATRLINWRPLESAIKSALENGVCNMPYSAHKYLLELYIYHLRCTPTSKMFADNPIDLVIRDGKSEIYLYAALYMGRVELFEKYLEYFINQYVTISLKNNGYDDTWVEYIFSDDFGSLAKLWEKHKREGIPGYHEFLSSFIAKIQDERTRSVLQEYNEKGKELAAKRDKKHGTAN